MKYKKSDIQVFDNFLCADAFYDLKEAVMTSGEWVYHPYTAMGCLRGAEDHIANYHFTNMPYDKCMKLNDLFNDCTRFLDGINAFMIYRLKFNLNIRHSENIPQGWHADIEQAPEGVRTGILYLHSTDGGTLLETDEGDIKVDCIENRFVSFPSKMPHSGLTHTYPRERCVLNVNYLPWE